MSGGSRKDGPGGNSSGKPRYQNPRGAYGGGGAGGLARGKMTNSHCMPAPVQLESMRRSTVDENISLTPQGGGGGGGGGGWSKEGKDEEEKGTKLEKREEGWKKPEVTSTLAHGFQDEFPSLTEQEKLSAKEKEELGKRHHQEAPPSHDSKSHFLRHDSLPRSSGSTHSAPPHHTHHHYQSSLPYRDNRSSRPSNYERSHYRQQQPRGPKQQRHLPYPPQSRSQSSNDPYNMSYFCDMPPPAHSSLSTASSSSYSNTPDERRKRQPGGGGGGGGGRGGDPLSSGHASSINRPIDVPDDDDDEGWAGHHEDIDYSKEVVFEDSSDEEFDQKRRSKNEDDDHAHKGGVSPPMHSRGDMYSTDDRYLPRSYHHGNSHPQQRGVYREGYDREHEGHASRPHPLILKKDRSSPIQSDVGGVVGEAPPTPDTPPVTRNAPKKILIRDLAEETDPSHAPLTDANRSSDQSESRTKMAWGPVPTPQPLSLVGGAGERREEGGQRNEDTRGGDEREERRPSFEEDDNKVYNIKDRGPIASDKVLYEPEGKASEEKFRKYHRMSSGDSTGAPRGGKGGKTEKQLATRSAPSPDDVFIEDTGSYKGSRGNQGRKGKRFQNDSPVPPQQHTPSPTYGKDDKRRGEQRKGEPEHNRREERRERVDERRERVDERRERKDWGKRQERRHSDDKEEPRKVGGAGGRGKAYDNKGREEYRGGREEERYRSSNNSKNNWEREQSDVSRRSNNRSDSHSSKQEQKYQNEHRQERRVEKQSDERRRGSQGESQKPASPVLSHERRTQAPKPQSDRRAQQKDRDSTHLSSEGRTEQYEQYEVQGENRPHPQHDQRPHPQDTRRTRPQDEHRQEDRRPDRRPHPEDERRPHPQDTRRTRPQDEYRQEEHRQKDHRPHPQETRRTRPQEEHGQEDRRPHPQDERRPHPQKSQTQLEDEYKPNRRSQQQRHQKEQRYTDSAQRYPEDAQRYTETAQRYTEDVRYKDKKSKQTGRPSPTEHEQSRDTLSKSQDTAANIISTKSGDVNKSQETRSSKPQDTRSSKPQDTRSSKPQDTRSSKPQDTRSSKPQDRPISKSQDTISKSQDIVSTSKPTTSSQDIKNKSHPPPPHPDDYEWVEDGRRSYNTGRGRSRRDHYSRQSETTPTSFPSLTFGVGYRGNRRGRGGRGGGGGRGRKEGGRDHRETEQQHYQQQSSSYYNELEDIESGSDWGDDDLLTDYEKNKKSSKERKPSETRRDRGGEKDLRNDGKMGGVKEVGGALEGANRKGDSTRSYEGPDPPLISTPPMMSRVGVVSPGGGGAKKSDGLLPTPKIFPEGILMLGSPVGGAEHGSHDNDGFTVVGSSKREKQKDKEKKRRNGPPPKHQYEEETRPGKGGGAKPTVEQSRVWSQTAPRPPKEVWSETEEKKEPSMDSDIVVPPTTAGQYGAIGDKSSRSQSSHKDSSSVSQERRSENNYRLFDNNNSGTPTFALQPKSSGGELHVLSEAIDSTLTDSFKVKTDPQLDPILEPPGSKPHPQETTPFQPNPVQRQGQAPPSASSKTPSQDKKRTTTNKRNQNNDRFYTPPPARADGGGRSTVRTSSSHKTSTSHAGQKGGGGERGERGERGGGGGGGGGDRGWNSGSNTNRHSKVMTADQSREEPELEEGEGEGDARSSKNSHSRATGQQQHQRGGTRSVGSAKATSETSKAKTKIDTSSEKPESSQVSKFGTISYASALKNRPVVSHAVEPVRVTGQTSSDPVPLSVPLVIDEIPISPAPPEVSEINNSPLSWKSETVQLSPLPPMGPEVLNSPVGHAPPVDISEATPLQTTPLPEPLPLPVPPQSTIVPVDPSVPSSGYPFDLRGGEGPLGAEPEDVEILASVEPHSDVKSNLNITANEFVPYHRSVSENSNASSSSLTTPTPLVSTVTGKQTNRQPKSAKTSSSSLAKVPPPAVLSSAPAGPQQQQSLLNQPPPHLLHVLHQIQVAVLTASQQQQHSKRSKPTTSHVSGTTSNNSSTSRMNPVNHSSASVPSSSQPVLQSIPHYPPPGGGSQPIPLMMSYAPHHSYPTLQNYQTVKSRVQAQPPPPIDLVQTIRPVHPTFIERTDGIHGSMAPPIHPVLPHGLSHQGIASVVPTTLQAPPTMYPSSHLPPQLATPSHVFMPPALPAGTGGLPVTFQQISPSLSRVPISTPTHIQSIEPKIHSTVRPPLLPTPPNFNLLVSATPTRPVQTTMATPSVFAPPPTAVWTGMRLGTSLNGSGPAPPPQHIVSPEGHPMGLPHQVV